MKYIATYLILLGFGTAFPQESTLPGLPKFQNQLVWASGRKEAVLLGGQRKGAVLFSEGKPERVIKYPPGLRILSWSAGSFYALKMNENFERVSLLSGKDEKTFAEIGTFVETTQNIPLDFLVPLEKDGHFLGYCPAFGFVKEGKGSLVGVFRIRDDGKIVLEEVPEIRLDRPILRIGKPKPNETFVSLNPSYSALAPFLDTLIQTPETYILVSTRAGVLWVLDSRNGSVRHTVKLFSVEDKSLGIDSDLEPAILGIQPRSDGKVVIASRDEMAFLSARKYFKYNKGEKSSAIWEEDKSTKQPALDDPDHQKREAFSALLTFRDILWWELDPVTGKLEQIHPEGAPTKLQTPQDLKGFRFHFEPGDKLKTSLDSAPAKGPKTEAIPKGADSHDGTAGPSPSTPPPSSTKKP